MTATETTTAPTKTLPFTRERIEAAVAAHPTPFHLYDERGIRENARSLNAAFSWCDGFREYFAVKAAPNPFLMKILKSENFGADCSSMAELVLAENVGTVGEQIMFTSNETPDYEYRKAIELGAVVNLDDISHISFVEQTAGHLPEPLSFRFNPGPLRKGNAIIGHPEEAKYGFTREQLFEGYRLARDKGIKRFGLHSMVASNELDPTFFVETTLMLLDLVAELTREFGIRFEFINIGGGIGIPYRPDQQPLDLDDLGARIRDVFERKVEGTDLAPLRLYMENGRMVTGPYGCLVTRAVHEKHIYKDYIGLDATMANLMRPGMYGAYHHITVLGKEDAPADRTYDVVGSLCENNDKFAINRPLPKIDVGDIVVIHDTGAHGHAMGFNYNGKLRSAELLLREDGEIVQIRRAETLDDLFATLDFDALKTFPA